MRVSGCDTLIENLLLQTQHYAYQKLAISNVFSLHFSVTMTHIQRILQNMQ